MENHEGYLFEREIVYKHEDSSLHVPLKTAKRANLLNDLNKGISHQWRIVKI